MVKRVLLILALGLAAIACTSPGSSSAPVETGPALESPSAPVESPAESMPVESPAASPSS